MLPPPRVATITSGGVLKFWQQPMAAAISWDAPGPWTLHGTMVTRMLGQRLRRTCKKSLTAAPVGLVTTAMCFGSRGKSRL